MTLRAYQTECLESIRDHWTRDQCTLAVMATGTGKTRVFTEAIKERLRLGRNGRAMVLCHREELVRQAARTLEEICGVPVGIEKADEVAGQGMLAEPIVVASVPSLASQKRRERFDPNTFSTLIADECHHATARTWAESIEWFRRNPALRVLGVTATPDRADEESLGQMFQSVCYDYEILHGIRDGWLIPNIRVNAIQIKGLDLSGVRQVGNDLNAGELAHRIADNGENLEAMGASIVERAGDRLTLVFADSVTMEEEGTGERVDGSAPRLTEIINGHRPGAARLVHGKTDPEERSRIIADFRAERFQYLVNVGIATEGFDVPNIGCVALGRPTKSRALLCQMIGRGTRPGYVTIDDFPTVDGRKEAMHASRKPDLLVIDFTDCSQRMDLCHPADCLGGRVSDRAVEQLNAQSRSGMDYDVLDELDRIEVEIRTNDELLRAASRNGVKAKVGSKDFNPFAYYGIEHSDKRGWESDSKPEPWQTERLEKWRIKGADKLTTSEANQIIEQVRYRARNKLATLNQVAYLKQRGYDCERWSYEQASAMMNRLTEKWSKKR